MGKYTNRSQRAPCHRLGQLHQELVTQDNTDQETSHMPWIRTITSPKTCNTRLHRPGNKPRVMDWDNSPTGHNEQHEIRLDKANYGKNL